MTVFPGWKHNRFGLAGNLDRPSAPGTAALEICLALPGLARVLDRCNRPAEIVEEISSSGAGELLLLYLSLESRESLSEVILALRSPQFLDIPSQSCSRYRAQAEPQSLLNPSHIASISRVRTVEIQRFCKQCSPWKISQSARSAVIDDYVRASFTAHRHVLFWCVRPLSTRIYKSHARAPELALIMMRIGRVLHDSVLHLEVALLPAQ